MSLITKRNIARNVGIFFRLFPTAIFQNIFFLAKLVVKMLSPNLELKKPNKIAHVEAPLKITDVIFAECSPCRNNAISTVT